TDRLVEFRQAKELPVSQRRDDPAFAYLHSALDLGLIPRPVGTRRHHSHPVVHRELLIGGIQIRIVATGSGDRRLGVIGYYQNRHPLWSKNSSSLPREGSFPDRRLMPLPAHST